MRYLSIIAIAIFLFTSCAKEKVTAPELEITTASTTYRAGDSITFNFKGNPDNITFFSGEAGHHYAFRERTSAQNKLTIEFKSLVQYGLIYKNLKLLVSNNFTGLADTNSIKAATWTDISDLAIFSGGADSVFSGIIDLSPYVNPTAPSSPVFIAFKYNDYKKTQGQNRWVIRTFSANNTSPEGVVTNLAVMGTGGWQAVNFKNPATVWSITTPQLLMYGGAATSDDNEDWVFSKGFDPTAIKPDIGTGLKNISATIDSYKYAYKTPGTYKAVFEISNVRYNGEQRATKEITFTITP